MSMSYPSILGSIDNHIRDNFSPVKMIVCSDGVAYNIGQGLLLNQLGEQEAKLSDCSELVFHIRVTEDGDDYQIFGRGPDGAGSPINLRYSIPVRDVIQVGYYTEDEYVEKLEECWPHLKAF